MNMNTPAKKKTHKRKFEGDENQHLHYSKSQKLVRERNRKAKLRKNPAMSIFEAGRERTKRIVKKEFPSINLNKPPSSIASLSNYTSRNKKTDDKSNKNEKDIKSTVYKRTTFRLPIREPSAQNFDMYYYLAPNREPATVTNILELYDETKSRLLQKKKELKASNNKPILPKEPVIKNKENYINIVNSNNKTNTLNTSKLNKNSISNKENNISDQNKKMDKENKGILTESNMSSSNILKPSSKDNKIKGKGNSVKLELDDNKENIPPLHHNQYNSNMNLQFVDYPSSGNTSVGVTSTSNTEQEENDENEYNSNNENIKEEKNKQEESSENKLTQRKTKPISVNIVSDEDLEEFFRVFDDLIPMFRSSTQLQEVIFETSQKEWNEWCYKVEQCEEETHEWLDARIMFYSRRILEYKKDWTDYWNKKRRKEKEMLELTSDISSDGLCTPNTPTSNSILSEQVKLLGSSPLPSLPLTSPSSTFNIPFQTPDDSPTSMIPSSETTPTKSANGSDSKSSAAFSNIFMNTDDLDLTSFSMDSNQDILSNMPLLYDTTNSQSGYPTMDYGLDSASSFDGIDPLNRANLNNNWLNSNPSSSLSVDDILFNTTTNPSDPNMSLLLNSLQSNPPTGTTDLSSIPTSLNFLNPLAATSTNLNPIMSIFDTNYTTTTPSNDNLLIPPSLVKLPSVSSTSSLIESFSKLNAEGKSEEDENSIMNADGSMKKKIDSPMKEKKEIDLIDTGKEKELPLDLSSATGTDALIDPNMTLLTKELGLEALFDTEVDEAIDEDQDKTMVYTPKASSTSNPLTNDSVTILPTTSSTNTNSTTDKDLSKIGETPKLTIKSLTDALITPTKPKDVNPTIDFFVDSSLINGNKSNSEFATPLYIKPPSMDIFSSIPKSYQEMYNDKMYSLISTLERCVQDKEDFWKVMEEFTSSIITSSSPIPTPTC